MKDNSLPIWNPHRGNYLEDPYDQLQVLRRENPIHRGVDGNWILFRYGDVKNALSSRDFKTLDLAESIASKNCFLPEGKDLNSISSSAAKWLFFTDPPEHTGLRQAVMNVWAKADFQSVIQRVVTEAIDNLRGRRSIEVVQDFAVFIPIKVICEILGLPYEDHQILRNWVRAFARTLEPFESLYDMLDHDKGARAFQEYVRNSIEEKRRQPDASFISNFLEENRGLSVPLSDDEMISVFIILFFAGIETTISVFSQSILALVTDKEQLEAFKRVRTPRTAVEEFIRYASPLQYTPRIALKDLEIGGFTIERSSKVLLSVAAANRDPEVFADPESLDVTRHPNPHLSFGHGFHHCVGAKLARDEVAAALPAFVETFPRFELADDHSYEWDNIIVNRSLRSLHVAIQ